MNKSDLANQYRDFTRRGAMSSLPDAETLLALSRGERADEAELLAELSQSALQSDLMHFARALEPNSSSLSAELAATFGSDSARYGHVRRSTVARTAAGRRPHHRAVAASLAAALMIAVGGFWAQRPMQDAPIATTAATQQQAPDRIFAALNDHSQSDIIFRNSQESDVIFRNRFSGS